MYIYITIYQKGNRFSLVHWAWVDEAYFPHSQTIRMSINPQKRKELLQTLQSLSRDVRQIKGCLAHFIYEDMENDNKYLSSDLYGVFRASMKHLNDSNHRLVREVSKIELPEHIHN